MTGHRRLLAVVFVVLLSLGASASSCSRSVSTLTQTQQIQVNLYVTLDTITTANKSVAQSMVALNAAGSVNDDTTRVVLTWSQAVNDGSRTALSILDSNQTPGAKAQAVLDLLKTLNLPPSVKSFVDSNPNVAAVIEVINSIVRIQQSISRVTATPPALLSTTKGGA